MAGEFSRMISLARVLLRNAGERRWKMRVKVADAPPPLGRERGRLSEQTGGQMETAEGGCIQDGRFHWLGTRRACRSASGPDRATSVAMTTLTVAFTLSN